MKIAALRKFTSPLATLALTTGVMMIAIWLPAAKTHPVHPVTSATSSGWHCTPTMVVNGVTMRGSCYYIAPYPHP